MRNEYFKDLEKIEFVITYACTGKCLHCSEGDHEGCAERIDPAAAADAVRCVAREFDLKTVMAFGGEPLLYPDAVYAIMSAATQMNVPVRQVITNGYFCKDQGQMRATVRALRDCGVNDLLLSADAFHQRTIPIEALKDFICEAIACNIPLRLQPAWLISPSHNNPYNEKTRGILESLSLLGARVSDGNIIFPEGNALKYLSEYFKDALPKNPYTQDPRRIKCISFEPNGDVLGGNIYTKSIIDIITDYTP